MRETHTFVLLALLLTTTFTSALPVPQDQSHSSEQTLKLFDYIAKDPEQLLSEVDEISELYPNFIDHLLEDPKFFKSLLNSISKVLYNEWVLNLTTEAQKKYLKIIITTNEGDASGLQTDQYFLIMARLLEDQQIGTAFLNSLQIDFTNKKYKDFVVKKYPQFKSMDFNNLTYEQKVEVFQASLQEEFGNEQKMEKVLEAESDSNTDPEITN